MAKPFEKTCCATHTPKEIASQAGRGVQALCGQLGPPPPVLKIRTEKVTKISTTRETATVFKMVI
jgi:hypothetical protein